MNLLKLLLLTATLVVSSCATKVTPLSERVYTNQDEIGLVLISLERLKSLDYDLQFRELDRETGKLTGQSLRVNVGLSPIPLVPFGFTEAKPGYYVLTSFSKQRSWSLCFNEQTYGFEVKSGQATLVGEMDIKVPAVELQLNVRRNGDTRVSTRNGAATDWHHYFDNVTAPSIKDLNEEELAEFSTVVHSVIPGLEMDITQAKRQAETFKTGRGFYGTKRHCTGWQLTGRS